MTNFYDELNITHEASPDEVKKAYRRLSLTCHPDRCKTPEAAQQFERITRAYDVLSDAKKRQIYDRMGIRGVERYETEMQMRESAMIPQCRRTVVEVPVSLDQFFTGKEIPVTYTVTNHDTKHSESKTINITLTNGMSYDQPIGIPDAGDSKTDMRNGDVIIKLVRPDPDPWADYEMSGPNIQYTLFLSLGDLLQGYDRLVRHPNGQSFRLHGQYKVNRNEPCVYIAEGLGLQSGDFIVVLELDIMALMKAPKEFKDLIETSQYKKIRDPLVNVPDLPAITLEEHKMSQQRRQQSMFQFVPGEGPQNSCTPQ